MDALLSGEGLIALLTLTFFGNCNWAWITSFLSPLSLIKLPQNQQAKARNIGLAMALIFRIALLLGITWIIGFTEPLFSIFGLDISGRDLILFAGGIFLLAKSTSEIHHKIEGEDADEHTSGKTTFAAGHRCANHFTRYGILLRFYPDGYWPDRGSNNYDYCGDDFYRRDDDLCRGYQPVHQRPTPPYKFWHCPS